MLKNLACKLGVRYTASLNKLRPVTKSTKINNTTINDVEEAQKRKSDQLNSQTKDLVEILVLGAVSAFLYYGYQRYQNWLKIKDELISEDIEIKGFKSNMCKINGYFFPKLMTTKLNEIKEFKTRPSDVWVASFPKSGTTWLQEIVFLIENNCDFVKAKSKIIEERSPYIEFPSPGIDYINKMDPPRVIKTHLSFEFLPNNLDKKSKIVYIVRNPKDVCVSSYYFFKMVKEAELEAEMPDMIDLFIEGKVPYGPWPDHVNSYASHPKVHFIHYEDLLRDPKKEMKRLCVYLEKKLDDKQLDAIINWCSFENMKNNPTVNYEWKKKSGQFAKEGQFFRKGQAGDWTNYFTSEQSYRLDKEIETRLNYNKTFDYGFANEDLKRINLTANHN